MITGLLFDNFQYDVTEEEGIAPKGDTGQWGCLKCRKVFARKYVASRHYISHHMVTAPETCSFCKKMYKNKNSLTSHLRIAHGIKQIDLQNRVVPNPNPE